MRVWHCSRKAWLEGLNPKENRDVPPLRYDYVYQLKKDFPELDITINGGITSLQQAAKHLQHVDGVMIGREAYYNTYLMADIDKVFYERKETKPTRKQIIAQYVDYIEQQMTKGVTLIHLTRHVLGLVHGCPGARQFRRVLSENAYKKGVGPELLLTAADRVQCD